MGLYLEMSGAHHPLSQNLVLPLLAAAIDAQDARETTTPVEDPQHTRAAPQSGVGKRAWHPIENNVDRVRERGALRRAAHRDIV